MTPVPPPCDWNHVRAFLAAAEAGSFSGAARHLGLTQPTLGRQVAALEAALGVLLFERAGRGLALTEAGRDLLEHARAMAAAAERMALIAAGRSQAIEGRIRITASDVLSAHVLPPILARLRQAAPRLEITLVAANDIRDLMRREADIAIRHVRPDQPDLIARLVRQARGRFYAAPIYLAARGRPGGPADLAGHDFVHFGSAGDMVAHLRPLGLPVTEAQFPVGSQSGVVAWQMARQGLGIAVMAEEVGDACQGMERVLPGLAPVIFPIWLVSHRELHTSRRIRLVFDMLAEALA